VAKKNILRLLGAGLFTSVVFLSGCSSNTVSFPEFSAPVVDVVGAVDDAVETSLSTELEQFRIASGPQIAVAVIGTTGEASIEDYSIDLARTWAIGDAQKDDGVLILLALDDRELRIDVGSGVEGDLTDVAAGRIIDEIMLPLLRVDDVNGAVTQGARAVMSVWRGEQLPTPSVNNTPTPTDATGAEWVGILLFFFFVGGSILLAVLGQFTRHTTWTSGGSQRGYGGVFIPGGFGGSGGGFGGGGFSGGFGGGFSGGGAGGSW
jgi:uncharacterized protein